MVSTSDSDSGDLGSIPSKTYATDGHSFCSYMSLHNETFVQKFFLFSLNMLSLLAGISAPGSGQFALLYTSQPQHCEEMSTSTTSLLFFCLECALLKWKKNSILNIVNLLL